MAGSRLMAFRLLAFLLFASGLFALDVQELSASEAQDLANVQNIQEAQDARSAGSEQDVGSVPAKKDETPHLGAQQVSISVVEHGLGDKNGEGGLKKKAMKKKGGKAKKK